MKSIISFLLILIPFFGFSQMTDREQQVLDEINMVRTNPSDYIKYIDPFLEYWSSGPEEQAAAKELKNLLKTMKPLEPLEFSSELYTTCKKHGQYIIKTEKFEHSNFNLAENIQYGNEDIRFAVLDLLIDGGVASRGHRKNILNPKFKYFAVYEILPEVDNMNNIFIQQFSSEK